MTAWIRRIAYLALVCSVSACSSMSGKSPPPPAPGVKLGKPYSVNGNTYTPKYEPNYDETGVASWYGPGFHGKYTANGEVYDQDDITAAHPTLPLPCLIRVTNLENGKTAIVRVNDRGPFKDRRLIDLSRGSAKLLGVTSLSKVRVQFLKEESEQYWASRQLNAPSETLLAEANSPLTAQDRGYAPNLANAEIKTTAPIMTVSSNDLTPTANAQPAIMPIKPSLRLINEAYAEEVTHPEPPPAYVKRTEEAPQLMPASFIQPAEQVNTERATMQAYSPEENTATRPPPDDPPILDHGWYVQVGLFASAENADAIAKRASTVGETHNDPLIRSGKTYQRVRVGPLPNRKLAEAVREKIVAFGVPDARVLKE